MNFFLKLIFLTLLSISAFSQTDVSGTLTADTEWTLAGSPYTLTAVVGIPSGVTLTIQAGVQVTGNFDLLIKGKIVANGSNLQPVIFENTRVIFKSADLSLSTMEYINFIHGGIQLADESEFSYDNPKNSNALVVRNSSFTNNSYARTKGYQSSAKLRLEDCSFDDVTILGYYPWSEMIELEGATITNSTIRSDSYNYGITIQNSTISNSTFMMGCCDANFSIRDSEITNSGFVEGGGNPVNGLLEFLRVNLTDTYINLPSARFYVEECNIMASSIPEPTIITIGSGELKKTTIEGDGVLDGINITGDIGNNTTGSIAMENVTFKAFDTALEIADFATFRINQSNFLSSTNTIVNTSNKDVDATGNYWGTDDENVIKAEIIDSFDNLNYGTVDYAGFFDSPVLTNPLLTPAFLYEGIHADGTLLFWTKINNPEITGYKIYKKVAATYTLLEDVGNVNTFVLSENASEDFVVTAYNAIADGLNDQQEGNESAYSEISRPFIVLDNNNVTTGCEGNTLLVFFALNYTFDADASLHLITSLEENFTDADTAATISGSSSNLIEWILPDTLTAQRTFYYRIASDAFDIYTEIRSVEVTPGPTVDFMIESINCTPGAYQVNATGIVDGMIVHWYVDGISLTDNTEVSSFTATWSTEGERTLTMVAEQNGCETTVSKIVPVIIPDPLPIPEICSIEYDESSGNNKISWEYTHTKLLEIKVYRETTIAGEFELIATIPTGEQFYIDNASIASQRAYRYRISAIDKCGHETDPGEAVKSFHLQLWPGIDDNWNLSWEPRTGNYEIEIYRRSDADWQKIAGLASVHNSYTDTNLPDIPSEYYALVKGQGSCVISSNIVSNGITSLEAGKGGFSTYPNPATDEIRFHYAISGKYELLNMQGIPVLNGTVTAGENRVLVSTLAQGIYVLKVQSHKNQFVTRIFKKAR